MYVHTEAALDTDRGPRRSRVAQEERTVDVDDATWIGSDCDRAAAVTGGRVLSSIVGKGREVDPETADVLDAHRAAHGRRLATLATLVPPQLTKADQDVGNVSDSHAVWGSGHFTTIQQDAGEVIESPSLCTFAQRQIPHDHRFQTRAPEDDRRGLRRAESIPADREALALHYERISRVDPRQEMDQVSVVCAVDRSLRERSISRAVGKHVPLARSGARGACQGQGEDAE